MAGTVAASSPTTSSDTEAPPIRLDELRARVGSQIGMSDWITVDQDLIDRFADVSGDFQFIHVDADRAAQTPFGTTIAHGFLVLCLISQMRADAVARIDGTVMGINYGFNKVRFTAPVKSGARVRGRFTLDEITDVSDDQVQMTWGVTVEIEGEDKPGVVAQWLTRAVLAE